jgi:hypothetical protein
MAVDFGPDNLTLKSNNNKIFTKSNELSTVKFLLFKEEEHNSPFLICTAATYFLKKK